MKIGFKFNWLFIALLVVGCRPENSPETRLINQNNAKSPQFVVDTPRGKLYRINIDRGEGNYPDRIYFFDTATNSVTVNSTVANGKSSYTKAVLVVDGVEYVPKN